MIKQILSVIAGYAIFVISSLVLFKVADVKPHSSAPTIFIVLAGVYGAAFSFLSGLTTQLIADSKTLKTNYALALVIAGFAAFSYLRTNGDHWSQQLAILIFAPMSILGGYAYFKRKR